MSIPIPGAEMGIGASEASDGLVELMLKEKERLAKIFSEVDLDILENVDEYFINLGENFSPYSQGNGLREFKDKLNDKGYSAKLGHHQDSKNYQLAIRRSR